MGSSPRTQQEVRGGGRAGRYCSPRQPGHPRMRAAGAHPLLDRSMDAGRRPGRVASGSQRAGGRGTAGGGPVDDEREAEDRGETSSASRRSATSTAPRPRRARFQPLFAQVAEQADVLAALRRPDRLRPARGGARAGRGAGGGREDPGGRGAGQPRLRVRPRTRSGRSSTEAGVTVLDGDACEIRGVGFAGVKGFGGGFGRGTLGAWGEPAIKAFVQEAVDEALKLESALARLRTPQRIAVLHYSPIRGHGRGRAAGDLPVPRLQPAGGAAQPLPGDGRVPRPRPPRRARGPHRGGVPVYNVALPLMRQIFADGLPFRVIELPSAPTQPEAPAGKASRPGRSGSRIARERGHSDLRKAPVPPSWFTVKPGRLELASPDGSGCPKGG